MPCLIRDCDHSAGFVLPKFSLSELMPCLIRDCDPVFIRSEKIIGIVGIDALFDKGLRLSSVVSTSWHPTMVGIDALFDKGLRLTNNEPIANANLVGIDALFDKGIKNE
jgi:hypothetical protein